MSQQSYLLKSLGTAGRGGKPLRFHTHGQQLRYWEEDRELLHRVVGGIAVGFIRGQLTFPGSEETHKGDYELAASWDFATTRGDQFSLEPGRGANDDLNGTICGAYGGQQSAPTPKVCGHRAPRPGSRPRPGFLSGHQVTWPRPGKQPGPGPDVT